MKRRHIQELEFLNWMEKNGETNTFSKRKLTETLPEALDTFVTPRQRQVLLLYLQGNSQSDIAKILGIDASTVCRTFNRALKNLKNIRLAVNPFSENGIDIISIDQFLRVFSKIIQVYRRNRRAYILSLIENNFDFEFVAKEQGLNIKSIKLGYKCFLQDVEEEVRILYKNKTHRKKIDIDTVCDGFCKYPRDCISAEELAKHCENCPIEKALSGGIIS